MTPKKNKKINPHLRDLFYWIIFGLAAAIVIWLILFTRDSYEKETTSLSQDTNIYNIPDKFADRTPILKKSWVEFSFKNGEKRLFEGEFRGDFPLSDILEETSKSGLFEIQTQEGKIMSIDGKTGNWRIYHNNEAAGVYLDGLRINGGDKYILKQE